MTEPEIGDVITIWNWGPNGPLNQRCHWAHVFDKSPNPKYVHTRVLKVGRDAQGDDGNFEVGETIYVWPSEDRIKIQKRPPGWALAKIAELALLGDTE
jgi:hypothetical protein